MISKNFFIMFVLSFFVVGFFFLTTAEKGFSQIGCCQNPAGNCVAAKSNDGMGPPQTGDQMDCEDNDFIWFAGVTCNRTGPPQDCPGFIATGCCVHGDDDCTPDQTTDECMVPPNVQLALDTACDDVPQCNIPPPGTGCCVHGDDDCTPDQTTEECMVPPNVQFVLDTACSGVPQCNIPPPGTGCCVISENNCVDDQTDVECTELGGIDFVPQTDCDFVPQCNVPPPPIVTNVPTISQWGMIAMAGLLGIFSLFIIMRRHRYNVS